MASPAKKNKVRGRKPKPLAQREAEGDARKWGANKLRAKAAAEPKATPGLPPCPDHLHGRARKAWTFWADELAAMKIEMRPDAMMLEGACVNYSRAVDADVMIAAEGITVTESAIGDSGEVTVLKIKAHPAVSVSNAAWRQLRAFCGEFGLSPVSRTRLAIDKGDNSAADLAKILSAPRPAKPVESVQ